ncbi:VirK/YbjX family protein [Lonsdalea iberica]|uniref:VirK protein n=1 Tax=Lonsdalea iberica TaxID=1082703 RepID=A0A1X3S1P6_9GAMM|nr:VirK/YbjX family protein [Lonsdalea iberica]OSN08461.1 VirK protein [Lonsdalea iberica]
MKKISRASLFLQLLSGHFRSEKIGFKNKIKAKFLLRSLLFPFSTYYFLGGICAMPCMQRLVKTHPCLPTKIHRPYLHVGLNATERAKAICHHYTFVESLSLPRLHDALLSETPCRLAEFYGKEGEKFTIVSSVWRYDKEGETTLQIGMEETTLISLSFSIVNVLGQPAIVIGGLQGKGKQTTRDLIKQATKACHGLFPKRLLIESLLTLADLAGIRRVLAVGDGSHVYQSQRYHRSKKNVLFCSYDEFWTSLDAVPTHDSLYQLPLPIARKPLEALPSNKRAQYRRRYQLIDELHAQLAENLSAETFNRADQLERMPIKKASANALA